VRQFSSWVQEHFGSNEAFMDKIGLEAVKPDPGHIHKEAGHFDAINHEFVHTEQHDDAHLTVSDLAARLTTLGYPGNALHVAMIAAKACDHRAGNFIMRTALLGFLMGKRKGAPPQRSTLRRTRSAPKPTTKQSSWRPAKAWTDKLSAVSLTNDHMPACVRTYFSVPEQGSGFSEMKDTLQAEASNSRSGASVKANSRGVSPRAARGVSPRIDRAVPASLSARARSLTPRRKLDHNESGLALAASERGDRYAWGNDRPTLKLAATQRPAFDNHLDMSSEVNARKSKYAKKYFIDYHDTPVKRQVRASLLVAK